MPGQPQNSNSNPLSFSGTKALRDLLLIKNLPNPEGLGPYGNYTNATYSTASLAVKDVIDQPAVTENSEFFVDKLYLANAYGPEGGFGNFIKIYTTSQGIPKVNEGPYPNFTAPETGTGLFGENPFRIVARYYSPIDILLGVSAEGLLSQTLLADSPLQQAGAIQLRAEFQERIAQELYQETIGRLSFVDALQDPVDALDIVTGRQPLINRDYTITQPKSIVGKGLDFVSRLTGVYVPYSYIPGDYFELEPPRGLSTGGKVISDITGILGSLIGIPRRRQSPSQRFLEFTGGGTKSKLFKALRFNKYGPQYGEGAQAQTAVGAVFGEVIDFVGGGILGFGNNPPNLPQYVGGPRNRITDMTSPPDNTYAGKNYVPIYGPDAVAKEFDTNVYDFGMQGRTYTDQGNIPGGFTWFTEKTPGGGFLNSIPSLFNNNANSNRQGPQEPGASQGPEGSTDNTTRYQVPNSYDDTKSTKYSFREDSIMDATQQIIDSVPKGGARLKSVPHAMNQVSKVFNDGYKELTKGSRVRKFVNTDPTSGNGIEEAREYCRVWTKDVPYYTYDRLVRHRTNIRKETYSVLDNPFNLNIAPHRTDETGKGSSNIVNGQVKKYMFSLENLAWRTSDQPGLTWDDLPSCEKGPNGGRIMWFPPYDLSVNEASSANWTENTFVGRPEPVYTYNNTNRTGSLNFKIVVDHPSILNLIVRKELEKLGPAETDAIVDSFFAGCKKYDIFDLARKWKQFSIKELEEIREVINTTWNEESYTTVTEDQIVEEVVPVTPDTPVFPEPPTFYFDNDYPNPNTSKEKSSVSFDQTATGDCDNCSKYGEYLVPDGTSFEKQINRASEANKGPLKTFFLEEAYPQYNQKWPEFASKLKEVLDGGNINITLKFAGSASSIASTDYNKTLSKRRVDAIRQTFESYEIGGKNAFQKYIDDGILKANWDTASTLGESECSSPESGAGSVYGAQAARCRYAKIIDVIPEVIPYNETRTITIPGEEITKKRLTPSNVVNQIAIEKDKNTRREIANKVLKKLVTECDYFDMIKEENEFVYDSLKQKFKFFHPAFHAITPEGLNSRLTFLNQCVRPGATMPTKVEGGGTSTSSAARNTVFGAPPICVLRVGDFYHTKIAIDQVSFTYDDNLLDLNPEGIGVQPMIASVSLTFKYLGGQGIKEPVSRLQNALSFNFFANTEFYDDRAVMTVTDKDADEQTWLQNNADLIKDIDQEAVAEKTEDENTSANDGLTIGERMTTVNTSSGFTGTINYKQTYIDFSTSSFNYIKKSNDVLVEFAKTNNYISVPLLLNEKEWDTGIVYTWDTATNDYIAEESNLIGIPLNWENRVTNLAVEYKSKIDNGTTTIQTMLDPTLDTNQKSNLVTFLKNKTNEAEIELLTNLGMLYGQLRSAHLDYIKTLNPLNIINRAGDGYGENGKWTTLKLSGNTDVDRTSSPPQQINIALDTLDELGWDTFYINNLNMAYSDLMNGVGNLEIPKGNNKIDPGQAGLTNSGNYSRVGNNTEIECKDPGAEVTKIKDMGAFDEYILFGKEIFDKKVVNAETNNSAIRDLRKENSPYKNGTGKFFEDMNTALDLNSNVPIDVTNLPFFSNEFINVMNGGMGINENYYLRQLLTIQEHIVDEFCPRGKSTLPEGLDSSDSFVKDNRVDLKDKKKRVVNYEKVEDPTIEENLQIYHSGRNIEDPTFNLKFN